MSGELSQVGKRIFDVSRDELMFGWEHHRPAGREGRALPSAVAPAPLSEQRPMAAARAATVLGLVSGLPGAAVVAATVGTEPVGWCLAVAGGTLVLAGRRITAGRRRQNEQEWRRARETFERASFDAARERRTVPSWFPVLGAGVVDRYDAVGGSRYCWASMIATLAGSVLPAGGAMAVLDNTGDDVGGGAVRLAADAGRPARWAETPADLPVSGLFAGLGGPEFSRLVAEAVGGLCGAADTDHARAIRADILGVLTSCVAAPWTFRRLAMAARYAQNMMLGPEAGGGDALTTDELEALLHHVDYLRRDHASVELDHLRLLFELLASTENGEEASAVGRPPLWSAGINVLGAPMPGTDLGDAVAQLLLHRYLHDLRMAPDARGWADVLVVAGADRLPRRYLKAMTDAARRAGVRLLLLFEDLEGAAEEMIGTGRSATVVMRLGHAEQAKRAADLIGRDHRFVFHGLSHQVSTSISRHREMSTGGDENTSTSRGRDKSVARSHEGITNLDIWGLRTVTKGRNRTVTNGCSRTWSNTRGEATARETADGITVQRTYDFIVEPVRIQRLLETQAILVEPTPDGRRLVLLDCNPGIVLLDGASDRPRPGSGIEVDKRMA